MLLDASRFQAGAKNARLSHCTEPIRQSIPRIDIDRNPNSDMDLTPDRVREEYLFVRERPIAPLISSVRSALSEQFDTSVDPVSEEQYRNEVDVVFADGDRAVNIAALVGLLRELDVEGDYPGFVVDEMLGRELATTIAGGQPWSMLAQATFHYADIHHHPGTDTAGGDGTDASNAGIDDLDAALAAGFQTRLPGWEWTDGRSPFSVIEGE